jgi:hypothetical protein
MGEEIVIRNGSQSRTPYAGREFLVRVVDRGDHYGRDKALVHEEKEPFIEFYDRKYAGKPSFDPEGQFVTRYHAFVLANHGSDTGLDLMGHEPAWKIDPPAMQKVVVLARRVTYGERGWREGRAKASKKAVGAAFGEVRRTRPRKSRPSRKKARSSRRPRIPEHLKRPGLIWGSTSDGLHLHAYADTRKILRGIPDDIDGVPVTKHVTGGVRPA